MYCFSLDVFFCGKLSEPNREREQFPTLVLTDRFISQWLESIILILAWFLLIEGTYLPISPNVICF